MSRLGGWGAQEVGGFVRRSRPSLRSAPEIYLDSFFGSLRFAEKGMAFGRAQGRDNGDSQFDLRLGWNATCQDLGVVSNYPRNPQRVKYFAAWAPFAVRSFGLALALNLLVDEVLIYLFGRWHSIWEIEATAGAQFAFLMFIPALVAIFARVFPIQVLDAGLRSFNGYGIYSLIAWQDLEFLGTLNIPGFRYHRFRKPGLLWATMVPYELDDRYSFMAEFAFHLGPENPIVSRLANAWGPLRGERRG